MLKVYSFFKNVFQFLKIIDLFLITVFLLHWIEHLLNTSWGWMNFFRPLFEYFINMGQSIGDGSIMLFAAIFEFKYFWALVILALVYGFIHLCFLFVGLLEKLCIAQHNMATAVPEGRQANGGSAFAERIKRRSRGALLPGTAQAGE